MVGKNATELVKADGPGIARAAQILGRGGLVAVPTETVYGLAARADDAEAVARIYAAKGRPGFNPLIVHVSDVDQARRYAGIGTEFGDLATSLAEAFWPGPLTLVLPVLDGNGLAPAIGAGLPTLALRAPAHPVMRQLLAQVDFPIAAPSANRSGFISPTTAQHVLASLDGQIDLVVDGGACEAGLESTIVAVRPDGSWQVLRPGPIHASEIGEIAGGEGAVASGEPSGIEAPGQLASHYAPGKPVRLNASEAQADEFMIGFGAIAGDCTLSPSGSLTQAAARLYDCLHQGAKSAKPRIAIAPVPAVGMGVAINDRIERAATPAD